LLLLALFTTVSCGASTGVFTVLVQFEVAGHVGSPPPEMLAVFDSVVPFTAAVGVTGITKFTRLPGASPAAIVQVTAWPIAEHPPGSDPIVRPPGIVSVIVAVAVVAADPVLLTCSV
jgi:hypothetical protein